MPFDLEIEWNVVQTRRFLGKGDKSGIDARVLDLSLDGALIEVPMPTDHQRGERVSIRLLGEDGCVRIRHRRLTATENRMHYGVQLEMTEGLRRVIIDVVTDIQGRTPLMQQRWEASR